jgi:cytochrome P450
MKLVQDVAALEIQRRPLLLRSVLGLLRRKAPVLRLGTSVFVTGEPQVREVFSRPTDFLFGFDNGPKMKLGPFLFGMDASRQYFEEKDALWAAINRQDRFDALGGIVARQTDDAFVRLTSPRGQIDLVSAFIEPVLLTAMAELYGIDVSRAPASRFLAAKNGFETFAEWVRKLGGVVGSSWPAPFGLEELSDRIAPEMATFLEQEARRAPAGTVMAELGKPFPDPADVARCVGGLLLAGAAAVKAATLALHELLVRRGSALAGVKRAAKEAAQWGDTTAVWGYALEALRFRPAIPMLTRYCPRRTVVAAGTSFATEIAAGDTVIVAAVAAMFDPDRVAFPEQFVPTRRADTYYHFGFGLHRCFGARLARIAIAEILTFLFNHFEFPAPGRLTYDGPAVARYDIRLSPCAVEDIGDEATRVDGPRAPLPPHFD